MYASFLLSFTEELYSHAMNREIKKVKKEIQLMKTIWRASPPENNELLCVFLCKLLSESLYMFLHLQTYYCIRCNQTFYI